MRALVLNVGSSTLKWSLLDGATEALLGGATTPFRGSEDAAAVHAVLAGAGPVDAVGHRIVHGGPELTGAVRVDARVREALGRLVELDPLHAPPALAALDAARAALPQVPQVVAFDTAFHATLPEAARVYAVPERWTRDLGVRRYGFHGLSVEHATRRTAELLGAPPRRLVVCHLGSGSSLTAVRDGRSIDTTMGMTPLEGVVMATRSGSVDPGVILLAARRLGLDAAGLGAALEHDAGLAGLSGVSGDLRDVRRAAAAGDARAALAIEVLVVSYKRALGAMVASLGGVDALAFTGGIGENDALVRREVAAALAFAGLALDAASNERGAGDRRLDARGAAVAAVVVRAREDLAILRAIRSVLGA